MASNEQANFDDPHNAGLRKRSGPVSDNRKLVSFLYELMRNHVPPGVVEECVRNSVVGGPTQYCNGYLAKYAQDIADRLE